MRWKEAEVSSAGSKKDDPTLKALGRISSVQQSGEPYSGDPDQLASLIANARTPEELNEILFGTTDGPQAS
jgi:hypothetical protein